MLHVPVQICKVMDAPNTYHAPYVAINYGLHSFCTVPREEHEWNQKVRFWTTAKAESWNVVRGAAIGHAAGGAGGWGDAARVQQGCIGPGPGTRGLALLQHTRGTASMQSGGRGHEMGG